MVALATCLACAACGNEDEGATAKDDLVARLIGAWVGDPDAMVKIALEQDPGRADPRIKRNIELHVKAAKFEVTFARDSMVVVMDKDGQRTEERFTYVIKGVSGKTLTLEGTDEEGDVVVGTVEFRGDLLILTRADEPLSLVVRRK